MLEYQRKLYEAYHTTHVTQRKGADDRQSLVVRGKIWDKTWRPLLPGNKEARIFDGACGNGAMVNWLHMRGFIEAEGVDISPQVIAEGHRLGIDGISVGDFVDALQAREAQFDVVILRDVLEHVPKAKTLDVLQVVRQALRPGGRLILHVPNADSPFFGRIRYGDFTHETAFTPSSLTQVLLSAGYRQPTFRSSPPVASSTKSVPRVALFRLVQGGYKFLSWVETGKWPEVVTQNLLCSAEVA